MLVRNEVFLVGFLDIFGKVFRDYDFSKGIFLVLVRVFGFW